MVLDPWRFVAIEAVLMGGRHTGVVDDDAAHGLATCSHVSEVQLCLARNRRSVCWTRVPAFSRPKSTRSPPHALRQSRPTTASWPAKSGRRRPAGSSVRPAPPTTAADDRPPARPRSSARHPPTPSRPRSARPSSTCCTSPNTATWRSTRSGAEPLTRASTCAHQRRCTGSCGATARPGNAGASGLTRRRRRAS